MGVRETILVAGDVLLAVAALLLAACVRFGWADMGPLLWENATLGSLGVFILVTLFASHLMEGYDLERNTTGREIATNTLFGVVTSFALLSVVYYLDPAILLGRGVLVGSLLLYLLFQFGWHALFLLSRRQELFAHRVLILGTGSLARQMGELLTCNSRNLAIAGYAPCVGSVPVRGSETDAGDSVVPAQQIVGEGGDLLRTARETGADLLVVALTERRGFFPLADVLKCKLSGITVMDAPSFYEFVTGSLLLESITPSWFIFSSGFRRTTLFNISKRVMDILLALVGLLLTFPLFPLMAVAIRLDSPGPVFFRQERVGAGERLFTLIKFRSMRQDAEQATGAVWAEKNDPRVTPLGKFLRGSRIDEIPQLINVLKGEMSLIGPRPERPEFVEKLKLVIPYYSKRHFIKPGLTGWAQVRYPYGSSVEDAVEKLRYDLYYTKNVCPFLDTLIFLETIKVVLFGRGGR